MVDVIVQLKQDPVAVLVARVEETWSSNASAQAQVVRDHKQEVLSSHTVVLGKMEEENLLFEPKHYYTYIFNGIAGSARMADLAALASLPQVESVHLDHQVRVTLEDSVPLIGAPDVWSLQDSLGLPVKGNGVIVAIIDTGID